MAVTGASGFVGGALLRGLRERGYVVVGLSRRGPDISWDIAGGPLSHAPTVDAVVHCAALVRDGPLKPAHVAVNVEGTSNVLSSFPRARIVHISSASVYDPWMPKDLVREDALPPQRWLNGYGETKRAAEDLVRRLRPDAAVLRPHAVYGSGDTTLLPRILRARVAGRQLAMGDGCNRITLTAIANLVDAVAAALRRPQAYGPFNIGDPDTPTIADVLACLLDCLGLPRVITWIPRTVAWGAAIVSERLAGPREPLLSRYAVNQMSLNFTLSLDRARQELKWEPKLTHQSAFADLAQGARHG
ncbi:MAG TPA: NAD(P)-dependent oxidoreductase [Chloroflexota bacterium]